MYKKFGIRAFFSLVALTALLFAATSASPLPAFAQSQSNGQYVVQAGDTLSQIGEPLNLSASAAVIPNTGSATYTVQAGDTLASIAAQYGTTVAAMEQANPQLTNPSLIYAREVLNLPSAMIPNTGSSTYMVQAGNTLSGIAAEFGTTVTALQQANPQITDPNLIYTGEVLNLPVPIVIPNTGGRTYTVQQGDTLLSIATQFGTTVGALLTANPSIVNQDLIYPGEIIAIP
jgi:LysM repeat protein